MTNERSYSFSYFTVLMNYNRSVIGVPSKNTFSLAGNAFQFGGNVKKKPIPKNFDIVRNTLMKYVFD